MINTAVFSYWNKVGKKNTSGFNSFKDYLYSQTLAIHCARQHFPKIKFITNDFGKSQTKRIGLDSLIDEFDLSLKKFDRTLEKYFWGCTKIHAYAQQDEPFIHIDNDLYLWDCSQELRECELGFQSPEVFDDEFYRYYYQLLVIMENAPHPPQIILDNPVTRGLNCGIVAAHRLDIVKQWHDLAFNYVDQNREHLLTFDPSYKIHLNLLHEQYFIASLVEQHNIKPFFFFENDKIKEAYRPGNRFTHLWGTIKRNENIMQKVRIRVRQEQPKIANKIEELY